MLAVFSSLEKEVKAVWVSAFLLQNRQREASIPIHNHFSGCQVPFVSELRCHPTFCFSLEWVDSEGGTYLIIHLCP